MYCPNCNSNLMDGTKKCPFCGTEFNNDQNMGQQNFNAPQQNYYSQQQNYNSPQQNYNNYGYNNNYAPLNPPMSRGRSKPNTLGIIASIAILISVFLPFFSLSLISTTTSASASLFDGKDWIIFIPVAILGFAFSVTKMNKSVLIMGAISLALTIGEAVLTSEQRLESKLSEYWEMLSEYVELEYSYGFYILLAASILLLVAGIYGVSQDKKFRSF